MPKQKKTKKSRTTKKTKNTEEPGTAKKRSSNCYILFAKSYANSGANKKNQRNEIMRDAGAKWAKMPDKDKQRWMIQAQKEKIQFENESSTDLQRDVKTTIDGQFIVSSPLASAKGTKDDKLNESSTDLQRVEVTSQIDEMYEKGKLDELNESLTDLQRVEVASQINKMYLDDVVDPEKDTNMNELDELNESEVNALASQLNEMYLDPAKSTNMNEEEKMFNYIINLEMCLDESDG